MAGAPECGKRNHTEPDLLRNCKRCGRWIRPTACLGCLVVFWILRHDDDTCYCPKCAKRLKL
jgi:hypothetical protein